MKYGSGPRHCKQYILGESHCYPEYSGGWEGFFFLSCEPGNLLCKCFTNIFRWKRLRSSFIFLQDPISTEIGSFFISKLKIEDKKVKMKKSVFLILIAIIIVCCSKTEIEKDVIKPSIIILSPEIAEIVCTLDGEKNILAVINECDYPEILKSKEKVGSFSSPNIEKIVALQPDMIFIS